MKRTDPSLRKLLVVTELVQTFIQAIDTLAVLLERDLELQAIYFIGYHDLQDLTTMLLYFAAGDTWA